MVALQSLAAYLYTRTRTLIRGGWTSPDQAYQSTLLVYPGWQHGRRGKAEVRPMASAP